MKETADLAAVEFAENPEPRCPCVLLLDTSGSMLGEPIDALNKGLIAFRDDLARDTLASRRVEIAIVTFDSEVKLVQDFVTADQFEPPALRPTGLTSMAGGVLKALKIIEERKAEYKRHAIAYYRPWIFMITDGGPTDSEEEIAEATRCVKTAEDEKKVAFFAVGVEQADTDRLAQMSVRPPVRLRGLAFTEMFVWLSKSTQAVSRSKIDEQVALPPPGWTVV